MGLLLLCAAPALAGPPARLAPSPATQPAAPASRPAERNTAAEHQEAIEAETLFAQEAMARIGATLERVDTPHFVIWTNLAQSHQRLLAQQCEAMYAALQRIFHVPADEAVFLGKCNVFILSNREQFRTFCQITQGLAPDQMKHWVGVHRSFADGRTRILAYWPGNMQQLAETLVHEGSHAFLFRYRSNNHVVTWFKEGLAEHVVGLIFGTRCDEGRTAIQFTARLVRKDPQLLAKVMAEQPMLPGDFYPVAQSVVAFLVRTNPDAFVQLVHALKDQVPFDTALQQTYSGSVDELDRLWRQWVLGTAAAGRPIY